MYALFRVSWGHFVVHGLFPCYFKSPHFTIFLHDSQVIFTHYAEMSCCKTPQTLISGQEWLYYIYKQRDINFDMMNHERESKKQLFLKK